MSGSGVVLVSEVVARWLREHEVIEAGLRLADAGGRPHEQRVEEPVAGVADELDFELPEHLLRAPVGLEVGVGAREAVNAGGATL